MSAQGRSKALIPEPFRGEGAPTSTPSRARALIPERFRRDAGSATVADRWPPAWTVSAGALLLAWLAIGVFYRETLTVMVGVWSNSETFTHAFGVPVISAWLIWRKRAELRVLPPRPWAWALLPMLLCVLLWLAGDLMLVNVVTQFAVVALFVLAVPLVLGVAPSRVILFPLGFLFFAVPFGDFLMPMMMEHTADFTVAALKLSGIPVYREGLQFVIPSGNWSVVEACSGIRYLIASLMVGTLFAYLNYNSMLRRWAFVGVAIVVPIVANWLRAYLIVIMGHLSDNTLAVGVDHLIYGWLFFGVVIGVMFMAGARWAEPELPPAPPPAGLGAPAGSLQTGAITLAALCLVAIAPLASDQMRQSDLQAAAPRLELPRALGHYQAKAGRPPLDWAPYFQSPRLTAYQGYQGGEGGAGVHIAYFRGQDYQSKLVNSMHSAVKGDSTHWNLQNLPSMAVSAGDQALVLPIARVAWPPRLGQAQDGSILVARAYWVDGRYVASPTQAKLLNAWARLRGRGDDGALVMLSVHGGDESRLPQRLTALAAEGLPAVNATLAAARDRR